MSGSTALAPTVPAATVIPAAAVAPVVPAAVVPPATEEKKDKNSFAIWTADKFGKALNRPEVKEGEPFPPKPKQDASDERARQIIYALNHKGPPPPHEQLDLCASFERVLHALNHVYPGDPTTEAKFRLYYVRLFGLAHLALESMGLDTDSSKRELGVIERDLIDDEGPRVKNSNIRQLLRWAAWLSIPAFAAYVVLSFLPTGGGLGKWLGVLHASPTVLANFMLLWLGCFLGVCLSYALRKPDLTLEDLVTTDSDFLTPLIRLAFTGTLTMLLVMFSMLNIFDISIASHKVSDVANQNQQMLAFVVGVICGISEKVLSGTITTKTKALLGSVK